MSGDFIGLEITGIPPLQAMLTKFPPEIQDMVTPDLSEYVADTMRAYPTKKKVSRAEAYGQVSHELNRYGMMVPPGFFSWRQYYFVILGFKEGRLTDPYTRTQTLARAWRVLGEDRNAIVVNETPYAKYVQGPGEQSRHEIKGGWKDIDAVVKAHQQTLLKRAARAINRAARKVGLNTTGD